MLAALKRDEYSCHQLSGERDVYLAAIRRYIYIYIYVKQLSVEKDAYVSIIKT
jgi:hypothetical protein